MEHAETILENLKRSAFRGSFRLRGREAVYLQEKGMGTILDHGRDFIAKRLAPAFPHNDGKQTPMKNHPVFIAQHATATCCRGCLEKWHRIPKGRPLDEKEQTYVLDIIRRWLETQQANQGP
ncbi:MAG: DUF4186 domain-containing protein [Pseudomonadota bacterium]